MMFRVVGEDASAVVVDEYLGFLLSNILLNV